MRTHIFYITFLYLIAPSFSCSDRLDKKDQVHFNESYPRQVSYWDSLSKKFPNKDLWIFEFDESGLPKHFTRQYTEVNKDFFEKITKEVKEYAEWKDHLRVFYYSLNKIDSIYVGIFVRQTEFDGTSYAIDMLKVDEKGKILKLTTLAKYWTAAECKSFTSSTVFLEDMTMQSLSVQSCYDPECENEERVDSVRTINSIKNLDFRLIRIDTLNKNGC